MIYNSGSIVTPLQLPAVVVNLIHLFACQVNGEAHFKLTHELW